MFNAPHHRLDEGAIAPRAPGARRDPRDWNDLRRVANGSLFQAVSLAPNPALPPVIYATSSVLVFLLSALLASTLPALFNPVSTELSRIAALLLVLMWLYLVAGGTMPGVRRPAPSNAGCRRIGDPDDRSVLSLWARFGLRSRPHPARVNDCNCSICRRYGALWAYYKRAQVRSATENGPTDRACVRRYGGNINATRKRVHEAHGRVSR